MILKTGFCLILYLTKPWWICASQYNIILTIFFSRKPQNLTPPGSSDGGSSGSGQSPTSTHPGSPPPPISSSKRPGFQEGPDGFPTKRQRIAHNTKIDQIYRQPIENNSQRRPITDSRDASNMNPRSRESPTNGYFGNYTNGMLNDERNLSDDEDTSRKRSCDSNSLNFGTNREKTFLTQNSPPVSKMLINEPRKDVLVERPNGILNGLIGRNRQDEKEREREKLKCNKVSSSQNLVARVSPDSQTEGLAPPELGSPFSKMVVGGDEFPDYKLYVPKQFNRNFIFVNCISF